MYGPFQNDLSVEDYLTPSGRVLRARSYPHRSHKTYQADEIASSLDELDLALIRDRFRLPSNVKLRLPYLGGKLSCPRDGEVAVCVGALECRLRFPLQPFLRCMLSFLNLAPCQLNLNLWKTIL